MSKFSDQDYSFIFKNLEQGTVEAKSQALKNLVTII